MSFGQAADELIYKGKTHEIRFIELESGSPFLRRASREEMLEEGMDPGIVISSWDREYCCVWELRDDTLYLRDVSGKYRLIDGRRVKADWVTDTIYIPRLRSGNGRARKSQAENSIAIHIEKGRVLFIDQ